MEALFVFLKAVSRFIIKNWKIALIFVLAAFLAFFIRQSVMNKANYQRERNNVDILMDSVKYYHNRVDEEVAKVGVLEFTIGDLKARCSEDEKLIKGLKLQLKQVKEVVKVVTETKIEYRDSLIYVRDSVYRVEVHDKWYDLDETIFLGEKSGIIDIDLDVRDSLSFVVHSVPKHKFLGIRWGVRGYEVEAVNHNPDSHISYLRWVEVEKNRKTNRKKR